MSHSLCCRLRYCKTLSNGKELWTYRRKKNNKLLLVFTSINEDTSNRSDSLFENTATDSTQIVQSVTAGNVLNFEKLIWNWLIQCYDVRSHRFTLLLLISPEQLNLIGVLVYLSYSPELLFNLIFAIHLRDIDRIYGYLSERPIINKASRGAINATLS